MPTSPLSQEEAVSISVMSAAKTACEESGWKLTNLELQKLLYIAQMQFLLDYDHPLIGQNFEAWTYGPVVPKLYHRVKQYGEKRIKDVFFVRRNMELPNHKVIKRVVKRLRGKSPGELVEITHRPGGAWDFYYDPKYKGIVIPNRFVKREARVLGIPGRKEAA